MIELYTGTPGSGKSLHCAKDIYTKLRRRKNIIANFDINLSVFKRKRIGNFTYLDNSEFTPELLMDFAVAFHRRNTNGHIVEAQTTLILDECQLLFNCRDWQAKDRNRWATFFTQHRKYGYNVILITQFDRLIDRQIRSLVEYEVIHRKASNFKTLGFLIGVFVKGNFFVAVTRFYSLREKVGQEFFIMRKKYASLYDSYKLFSTGDAVGSGPTSSPVETKKEASVEPPVSRKIKVPEITVDELGRKLYNMN